MEFSKKDVSEIKKQMLIDEAIKWKEREDNNLLDVTLTEETFKHSNNMVKQTWDMSFLFYCIREIDRRWKFLDPNDEGTELPLDATDGWELFQKSDRRNRHLRMQVGDLVVLTGMKRGEPTKYSQVGVVVSKEKSGDYEIIEANGRSTFDPLKKNKKGIYLNKRHTKGDATLKILAHITPWREL